MQRKIDASRLQRVWVDRIVWNVVAAAVLAMMIAILLGSLQWLDDIDLEVRRDREGVELDREPEVRPARIVRADRARG